MKDLIEKIIKNYDVPLLKCYYDETCDVENQVIEAFIEFGKIVCELQKKKCLEEALILNIDLKEPHIKEKGKSFIFSSEDYYNKVKISTKSILNCKNVCDI